MATVALSLSDRRIFFALWVNLWNSHLMCTPEDDPS